MYCKWAPILTVTGYCTFLEYYKVVYEPDSFVPTANDLMPLVEGAFFQLSRTQWQQGELELRTEVPQCICLHGWDAWMPDSERYEIEMRSGFLS